jgi:hypothetical protein
VSAVSPGRAGPPRYAAPAGYVVAMSESAGLRLSLGLLAHNEEAGIGAMLADLFAQTIFDDGHQARLGLAAVELVCVPNGCTDATEAAILRAFADHPVASNEMSASSRIR